MVVVAIGFVDFIDGVTIGEILLVGEAAFFEQRQGAIDGGKAYVVTLAPNKFVQVFRADMAAMFEEQVDDNPPLLGLFEVFFGDKGIKPVPDIILFCA